MNERLTKATHAADFLVGDLREAHKAACSGCRNVEEIVVRDLLRQAVQLKARVVELAQAVELDREE